MFYNMLIRSLDRNPQNSGEVFQNAENRVWGRFQNVWKNIHPCFYFVFCYMYSPTFMRSVFDIIGRPCNTIFILFNTFKNEKIGY